jgi:hypothetical protein
LLHGEEQGTLVRVENSRVAGRECHQETLPVRCVEDPARMVEERKLRHGPTVKLLSARGVVDLDPVLRSHREGGAGGVEVDGVDPLVALESPAPLPSLDVPQLVAKQQAQPEEAPVR